MRSSAPEGSTRPHRQHRRHGIRGERHSSRDEVDWYVLAGRPDEKTTRPRGHAVGEASVATKITR